MYIYLKRYAVMGLGNLACNPANQKKIMQEGAVPALVSLARFENGDLEGQRYAALALTNLSATKSNHTVMMDTGCVTLFRYCIYIFIYIHTYVYI
jgi:hypothetical protein